MFNPWEISYEDAVRCHENEETPVGWPLPFWKTSTRYQGLESKLSRNTQSRKDVATVVGFIEVWLHAITRKGNLASCRQPG
jgi:hypothetical protein